MAKFELYLDIVTVQSAETILLCVCAKYTIISFICLF